MLILLTILVSFAGSAFSFSLNKPPHTQSSFQILYNSSDIIDQQSVTTFSVTFDNSFENEPQVMIGITGYETTDPLYNQLMFLQAMRPSLWDFEIEANISTNTRIVYIGISYFAVDNRQLFQIRHVIMQNLVNISQNQDSVRVEYIRLQTNTSATSISMVQTVLNGFWLRSTDGFDFQISHQIKSQQSSITVVFSIQHLAYLELIAFSSIIVDNRELTGSPFIFIQLYSFTKNQSVSQYYQSLPNITDIGFLVGFTGLASSTSNIRLKFYLSEVNMDSFQITNPNGFQQIRFASLTYGIADCPSQLWLTSNLSCVSQCPSSYTSQPSNSICEKCSPNCRKCSKSPTFCSACHDESILLKEPGLCSDEHFDNRILATLTIIPLLLLILVCYLARRKRKLKVENSSFDQHPSIQL